MNSQRLAQVHISPLRVQQGLVASLIVLIALLAIQQFGRWEQAREAEAARQAFIAHSLILSQPRVSAFTTGTPATARTLVPVDDAASRVVEVQPQQRWVF